MEILDLVDAYVADVLRDHAVERYERRMPELFAHIREFWISQYPQVNEAILLERRKTVRGAVDRSVAKLSELVDPERVGVVLFVGAAGTGHAFESAGRVWAWLPVEGYTSELMARAFVPHELAHAAHYARQPDVYFRSRVEHQHTGRKIITEGFATRMAMQWENLSAADALWADFLPEERRSRWLVQCAARRSELAGHVLDIWDQDAGDLFYFTDSDDVVCNRAGYGIALAAWMAVEASTGASVAELMLLTRSEIEKLLKAELSRMAG